MKKPRPKPKSKLKVELEKRAKIARTILGRIDRDKAKAELDELILRSEEE
jgi:hypothetical protein